ncbi:MAG: hypothetical protein EP332_10330 [Bacteroidetes bacterium]|nr:MAG: hypothetical protein EP332_10330 [Bacteroidota bacterium]
MGWSLSMVVIQNATQAQDEVRFIEDIGYSGVKLAENSHFNAACYPKTNSVYLGILNGNLIITAPDIAFENLNDSGNPILAALESKYPGNEIASFHLQSSVNGYGFIIRKSGETIRERWGDFEIHMEEIGEPLKEEEEYYQKVKYDADSGLIEGIDDEDEILDFEELVSEIGSRYFEKPMMENDALWDLEMKQYTYESSPLDMSYYPNEDLKEEGKEEKSFISRYWWVFVLAYVIVKVIVRSSR